MPIVPTQSDAVARVKEIKLSAVVTRCGCAARGLDFRNVHECLGGDAYGACPQPLGVEDKGVIASYSADDVASRLPSIHQLMRKARDKWLRQ